MSFDPFDRSKVKKIEGLQKTTGEPLAKADADIELKADFSTFQKEGNVFGVKQRKGKRKGFVPPSPRAGLDDVFGADNIDVANMKISTKLTKRFFDF